jgi:hypothetical protein
VTAATHASIKADPGNATLRFEARQANTIPTKYLIVDATISGSIFMKQLLAAISETRHVEHGEFLN